jgi:hypothetical protein
MKTETPLPYKARRDVSRSSGMNDKVKTFAEICVYQVKPDKTQEFEDLITTPKITLGERIE